MSGNRITPSQIHDQVVQHSQALLDLFNQQAEEKEALLARVVELEAKLGLPRSEEATSHFGMHMARFPNNPLEALISTHWNDKQRSGHVLSYLLGHDNKQGFVSQRDATVAATLIQWLASDVGQNFLTDFREIAQGRFLKTN
jgi:hypothetical protein